MVTDTAQRMHRSTIEVEFMPCLERQTGVSCKFNTRCSMGSVQDEVSSRRGVVDVESCFVQEQ